MTPAEMRVCYPRYCEQERILARLAESMHNPPLLGRWMICPMLDEECRVKAERQEQRKQ